jgi:hypothetical protein
VKKLLVPALLLNAVFLAALLTRLSSEPTARAESGVGAAVEGNGDVNGSGAIDISDPVYLLNFLFSGGPAPLPCMGGGGLPDTGQTQCFDCEGAPVPCKLCLGQPRPCEGFLQSALTLQDSMQGAGCPNDSSRFTFHLDGTVTDNCTGLQWLQDSGETPDDDNDGHPDPVTWCQAMEFCQDLVFAGHSDWRMPNVRELQSLVDYGRLAPAIAPEFGLAGNPSSESTTFYPYWTSTTQLSRPAAAFTVNFFDGTIFGATRVPDQFSEAAKLRVRPVRAGH